MVLSYNTPEMNRKRRLGLDVHSKNLKGPEGQWQHRAEEGGSLAGDGAGDGCGRWECWQSLCLLSRISILDF